MPRRSTPAGPGPRRLNSPVPVLPEPDDTLVIQYPHAGGYLTAISRVWPEGQSFCRLCPVDKCSLVKRNCLVVVPEFVATEDAPTFSVNAFFGGPALATDVAGADHGLRVYRGAGGDGHEPGKN